MRILLFLTLAAFTSAGCASQRGDWLSRAEQSGGSNSGGSNSGGSNSGESNNGNQSSQSDNSSDGPSTESGSDDSDSESKSSGTVTTDGKGGSSGGGAAVLVLVGLTLIGLTIASAVTVLNQQAAQAYLEKHGREVRLALARGDGTFVADVGHNLGLTPIETTHLGAVLRAARSRLEPLMHEGGRFMAELAQVVLDDPELHDAADGIMIDVRAHAATNATAP